MKRDFELIRELLIRIEEDRPLDEIPGVSVATRVYHINLLKQAGLLDSEMGLTWKGHDFLDQMRDSLASANALRTIFRSFQRLSGSGR